MAILSGVSLLKALGGGEDLMISQNPYYEVGSRGSFMEFSGKMAKKVIPVKRSGKMAN